MARSDVERALATAIDTESQVGIRWWPGADMATVAFRWSSFARRHSKTKHPTAEDRVLDSAKWLQVHFEPDDHTPLSEWLYLAKIMATMLESAS